MRRTSLLFAGLVAPATAQGMWLQDLPATVPAARFAHAMATDPVSHRVVMIGGCTTYSPSQYSAEMWQWTGTNWSIVGSIGGFPTTRGDCGFCEEGSTSLLMFGGFVPGTLYSSPMVLGDTWRLQGTAWTLAASAGPSPRSNVAMAPCAQGVLLFGGETLLGAVLGDTWLWNGTAWTQLAPAAAPAARTKHKMAFDSARGVVVLFGGMQVSSLPFHFGDTWEWDGTTWLQRTPVHVPPPRYGHAMAYSPTTSAVVMHGGLTYVSGGPNVLRDDTWAWNGTDWQQLVVTGVPPARHRTAMAFDGNGTAVLFGGSTSTSFVTSETFAFVSTPAATTAFGTGCPGPNALVPSLAAAPGTLPRLGTTLQLRVDNLGSGFSVPMLVLGLSNTTSAGPPPYGLPFDLGVLGWPGCQQLVSLESTAATVAFGNQVDFPFAIPLDVALAGFRFHGQAIVFYQPTGTAVSNAITAIVGA